MHVMMLVLHGQHDSGLTREPADHGPQSSRRCRYWEVDSSVGADEQKVPYRIEVVGVTCDAGLAVARGIWRKARTCIRNLSADQPRSSKPVCVCVRCCLMP